VPDGSEAIPPSVSWRDGAVVLIDQRRLPAELVFLEVRSVDELCRAISAMAVRGAPALGAAGAMGVALAHRAGEALDVAAARIKATRPTAVNLAWGVDRAAAASDPLREALRIAEEDVERNRRIGSAGAGLLADGARVLTHCNAGALACVGFGTAVGVIRAAHEAGRRPVVWATETRPVLQGARLTAWELGRLGVPVTVIVDGLAGALMAGGEVDCVIVGADRVAANGDVANKVGTYALAVLARHHELPFYVAAPLTTVDFDCPGGDAIPIERRPADEVRCVGQVRVVAEATPVDNRAFDVTPAGLVTAIITDAGIARAPYRRSLAALRPGPDC
jgi:methylthioribose-1-phosphate isomerase